MKILNLLEYIDPKKQRHPSMRTPNKDWYVYSTDAQRNVLDQLRPYSGDFDLLPLSSNNSTHIVVNAASESAEVVPGIFDIPLNMIDTTVNMNNTKEAARIKDLVEQIKQSYSIEPIWVMIEPDGSFSVMEGQHRVAAFQLMKMAMIPAKVAVEQDFSDEDYEKYKNRPQKPASKYQPKNDRQTELNL